MSISLYRKYRPQNFASLVGQKPAVEVLTSSITKGRIGHAYLFSGSRGCGKTSAARIFAKALNCLDPQGFEPCGHCRSCEAITAGESLDVIEIDGASNNGVDEVRQLKENITLAPFSSKYKIYIIDEVHMLSTAAFNALLKTLEEPPEYVVFIMATTEPHKVPVTIRSRCQHIPFHSITPEDIYARLEYVCQSEGVSAESEALYEIARQADGALRDALSLLEQVIASGNITLANVEAVFGAGSRPAFERWVRTLREDTGTAYTALKSMLATGASSIRVFEEMFSLVRNMWLASKWKGIIETLGLSESERVFLVDEASKWTTGELHTLLTNILRALTQARQGVRPDILLGMFMLSLEEAPSPDPPSVPAQTLTFTPPPASAPSPAPEPQPKDNPELRGYMMDIARDKNFVVYCALFTVKAMKLDGMIVLETDSPLTYETLRIDRTAAAITEIFAEVGPVTLKYGSLSTPCPSYKNLTAPRERKPRYPLRSVPKPPEDDLMTAPAPAPAEKPAPPEDTSKMSVVDKYRTELASYGLMTEVLFTRQNAPVEEIDDETEHEDIMPEGDDDE